MSHWTIFSDNLPWYDVATKIDAMWHAIANDFVRILKRWQHVVCFLLEFKNSQRCCQKFVKSTSLRNGMLHWNDSQRNIIANRIIKNRSVWHHLNNHKTVSNEKDMNNLFNWL